MMAKQKRKNDDHILDNYLQADEKLLWVGSPNAFRLLTAHDIYLIPFSLFWCSLVFPMVLGGFSGFSGLGFFGLLLPHFWIGLWLFPGRFIYNHFNRQNITYAITNRRLIILKSMIRQSFKSYNIKQLPEITVNARDNDTGTIKFSSKSNFMSRQNQMRDPATTDFYDIPDVWAVYHLIQELQYEKPKVIYEEEYYYEDGQDHSYAHR